MRNRLNDLFSSGKKVLSVYLTAGFPKLNDTTALCLALQDSGVDLIEIGFPFSDSLVDGPTIQQSNEVALKNGMSLELLFEQLKTIRQKVHIPLLLMGCINPVLQFGVERFAAQCEACGIDGLILPDLPPTEYVAQYRAIFERHKLHFILFVTPATTTERIRQIDELSSGFIYAVSSAAVTGGVLTIDTARQNYFQKLQELKLKSPILVGFGITDRTSFESAAHYTHGAIIGSAFIKAIEKAPDLNQAVRRFITSIRAL